MHLRINNVEIQGYYEEVNDFIYRMRQSKLRLHSRRIIDITYGKRYIIPNDSIWATLMNVHVLATSQRSEIVTYRLSASQEFSSFKCSKE